MKTVCVRAFAASLLIAALALGGCSANRMIASEWSNPAYSSVSFGRIMVGGAAEQTSIRRNFEDEVVTQLKSIGLEVFPSYRYVPEADKLDEVNLKQAAQKAGADGALLARPINVEQKTEISPGYYPVPSFGFFGPHFGTTWYGPFSTPSVRRYQVYTSEVTLYDVGKNAVVWTATLRTTEPDNVNAGIRDYVAEIVKALNEKHLLGFRQ